MILCATTFAATTALSHGAGNKTDIDDCLAAMDEMLDEHEIDDRAYLVRANQTQGALRVTYLVGTETHAGFCGTAPTTGKTFPLVDSADELRNLIAQEEEF